MKTKIITKSILSVLLLSPAMAFASMEQDNTNNRFEQNSVEQNKMGHDRAQRSVDPNRMDREEIQKYKEKRARDIEKRAKKHADKPKQVVETDLESSDHPDAWLVAKVKSKYAVSDTVGALDIDIDAEDGKIILTGKIESEAERAEAIRLAKNTEGVTSVVDHLVITEQEVKEMIEDEEGRDNRDMYNENRINRIDSVPTARATNSNSQNIDRTNTQRSMQEYQEDIEDALDDRDERQHSTMNDNHNRDNNRNDMSSRERIEREKEEMRDIDRPDGWLTTKVNSKFATSSTVGMLDINVDTEDNVVTLTGDVSSEAERDEALRLARETEGVERVVDNLTVIDDE